MLVVDLKHPKIFLLIDHQMDQQETRPNNKERCLVGPH